MSDFEDAGQVTVNLQSLMEVAQSPKMTSKRFGILFALMRKVHDEENHLQCSLREIAQCAGVNKGTVSQAVVFFEEVGVVRRISLPRRRLHLEISSNVLCQSILEQAVKQESNNG